MEISLDGLKPSPLFALLQIDTYFPVTSRICDFLSIVDIVYLTRTCRTLSSLFRSLIPHQWNVDQVLSRFTRDPKAFRSQLGQRNALVSGSLALQFFQRVTWHDSDIDIFVEKGADTEAMIDYVTKKEGYRFSRISHLQNYEFEDQDGPVNMEVRSLRMKYS